MAIDASWLCSQSLGDIADLYDSQWEAYLRLKAFKSLSLLCWGQAIQPVLQGPLSQACNLVEFSPFQLMGSVTEKDTHCFLVSELDLNRLSDHRSLP